MPIAILMPAFNEAATLEEIGQNHSPTVEITTFPKAGHNLHRTNFEAFAAAFDDFLTRT